MGSLCQDLDTGEEILLNNTPMYSASLIKSFVMAKTFQDMDTGSGKSGPAFENAAR